jgi:NAD(P)-dependent dehydrogenase (short-subunit alcohol dehydrogenase family)
VGVARKTERLQETLASLHGEGHVMRSFDLNETDSIPGLVAELSKEAAPFSGLVHCAGFEVNKPLRVTTSQDFESLYRINVVAGGMLLRGIGQRGVAAANGCSCVMLGSITGPIIGLPALSAYGSAKAGLIGLVRSAALEQARNGIRVNAILASIVRTEMVERTWALLGSEHAQRIEKWHPLGIGEPRDVAYAAAFLLADTARWITGTCLVLDGGVTAQ